MAREGLSTLNVSKCINHDGAHKRKLALRSVLLQQSLVEHIKHRTADSRGTFLERKSHKGGIQQHELTRRSRGQLGRVVLEL